MSDKKLILCSIGKELGKALFDEYDEYADGLLVDGSRADAFGKHLATCPSCGWREMEEKEQTE